MTGEFTYEAMVEELKSILERIDDGSTPIDRLATDVKRGALLIKKLDEKLKHIETEVRDAFADLDENEA